MTFVFGLGDSIRREKGICVGFTVMLLLVGLGFGQLFILFPHLNLAIKTIGTAYLLYLAWQIARATNVGSADQQAKPFGFIKGALFQWVNAKAWVVAIGAISAFTTVGDSFLSQNVTIAFTFFIASFPCVSIWLIFGIWLRECLENRVYQRWFNMIMAILLVGSVLPVVTDIWHQL